MINRILAVTFSFLLASALLGFLIIYFAAGDDGPVSLAELGSDGTAAVDSARRFGELSQFFRASETSLANLPLATILYGVLGLFAGLLLLRALLSVFSSVREARFSRARQLRGKEFIPATASARPISKAISDPHPSRGERISADRFAATSPPAGAEPSFRATFWVDVRAYWQGLTGRMIFTFAGVVAIFGFAAVTIVYFELAKALTNQAIQRATITAVNIADSAPGFLVAKNIAQLRELLRTHANKPGVAYALIENRAGEILADSFAVLPDEIRNVQLGASGLRYGQRTLKVGSGVVYETATPVMEGRSGVVRVGIWKDDVDAEIHQAVMPLIKLLVMVVSSGVFFAIILAWYIGRPILRLVRSARRISHGDLDAPSMGVQDATEFGELARALERMRSSVKAALVRLG